MRLTTNAAAALACACLAATTAFLGCGDSRDELGGVATTTSAIKTLRLVCHIPPGNPTNAHEMTVAASAVPAHLAHGDRLGPCVSPGSCAGQADGTPCTDQDLCTINDVCLAGVCSPGDPVNCSVADACQASGTCDPSTGTCSYTAPPDGTACNDQDVCTTGDACRAGICAGKGPGDLEPGETKTFTCPSEAEAIDGLVQSTTCAFLYSFSPNNVFTGPVSLISHLERGFADFDISTLADGRLQLACVYRNGDGLQIGGTWGLTTATSCTPDATSFVCTK